MTKIAVIEEKTSLPSSNVDLFLSKIIAQKDKNIDFVVAPEYAFSYSFDPMTESRKNDLLYKLKRAYEGKNKVVIPGSFIWHKDGKMYNSCPILFGGKVLKEIYKMNNVNEEKYANHFHLNFGTTDSEDSSPLFRIKDKEFGLDICKDYGLGRVKNLDVELDFHFVISCGKKIYEESDDRNYLERKGLNNYSLKDNGFLVHSEGSNIKGFFPHSSVLKYSKENDEFTHVIPTKQGNVAYYTV